MSDDKVIALLLETPGPFSRWLAGQPAETHVGTACYQASCPIAIWLTSQLGVESAYVHDDVIRVYFKAGPHVLQQTPRWAQRFIAAADGQFFIEKELTAGKCRKLLREVSA
jgi:hypothetical protein